VRKEEHLINRPYRQPALYELARAVGYAGRAEGDLRAGCDEPRQRVGEQKVVLALHELTTRDEGSGLMVLRPEVRKLCHQLLGPDPEAAKMREKEAAPVAGNPEPAAADPPAKPPEPPASHAAAVRPAPAQDPADAIDRLEAWLEGPAHGPDDRPGRGGHPCMMPPATLKHLTRW
jgi:hypothetical protein